MKINFKSEKGDSNTIVAVIMVLIVFGFISWTVFTAIYSRFGGNKTKVDLNYTFDKAITYIGNEKIEIDIDTWRDYDGEQLQIKSKDGKVYLVSSFNTILIHE